MKAQPTQIDARGTGRAHHRFTLGLLGLTLAMSVACAQGVKQSITPAANTSSINSAPKVSNAIKPRSTFSKTLHWFEIGQASWYGPHFQGKKTANGESFNMNELTCAHRSLPLGSWIRVTNLKNRRTIFVRVNDRGPVPENRVVDLSYAAAQAVGLMGIGKVKLEAVRGGDPELARGLVAQLQLPVIPTLGQ